MTGTTARITHEPPQPGDARHTYADCSAAESDLGYRPAVSLEAGLKALVDWQSHNLAGVTR